MFFTEWLESSHNQWVVTRVSHFYKISEPLMDKPSWFAHKKWEFFASEMIKIGDNFLFWLSSRAVLYFKDQVSPTCTEVDLKGLLSFRGQQRCWTWSVSGSRSNRIPQFRTGSDWISKKTLMDQIWISVMRWSLQLKTKSVFFAYKPDCIKYFNSTTV